MKLTKIIAVLALPFALLLSSCQSESGLEQKMATDKSVYEVGAEGGEVTIKLYSTQDWKANVLPGTSLDVVDDITVKTASGSASEDVVDVVVNVPENSGYNRKAQISFISSTLAASVTIEQAGKEGERLLECSVGEFLKKPVDASVYYILTGIVTNSTTPTTYSNFYLEDPKTGESVYVYGLAYKSDISNQKVGLLAAEGIQEGDEITIAGTRGEYNGVIEAMYSYYISHKKSEKPMIKLDKEEATVAIGESFELVVTSNKVTWTLSSDVEWISFDKTTGSESATVVVSVSGDGEGNTGVITLSAPDLEPVTCTVTRTNIQDVTVAQFLEKESGDPTPYRITGAIRSISASDKYHNADIVLAGGLGETVKLFRAITKEGNIEELGLKEGDVITVVGLRSDFKGEPQMAQGGYVESYEQYTASTISDFLVTEDQTTKFIVSGEITEIKDLSDKFNNVGVTIKDADGNSLFLYRLTTIDGSSVSALDLKVGGTLTAAGKKTVYKEVPQMSAGGYCIEYKAPAAE